jgi:hypothetical protein
MGKLGTNLPVNSIVITAKLVNGVICLTQPTRQ